MPEEQKHGCGPDLEDACIFCISGLLDAEVCFPLSLLTLKCPLPCKLKWIPLTFLLPFLVCDVLMFPPPQATGLICFLYMIYFLNWYFSVRLQRNVFVMFLNVHIIILLPNHSSLFDFHVSSGNRPPYTVLLSTIMTYIFFCLLRASLFLLLKSRPHNTLFFFFFWSDFQIFFYETYSADPIWKKDFRF